MPYTYANPPSFVKNKPEKIQKLVVDVFNRAIQNGRTEEEARFAAIAAMKAAEKPQNKVQKDFRTRPSHFPVRDTTETQKAVVEAVNESKGYTEKIQSIRREFLGDNALPTGVDRNVVSADFNEKNELVITFDTGERIVTRPIEIEQFVEQYTSLVNQITEQGGGIQPSNIKHFDMMLSGTYVIIGDNTHKIHEIIAMYFTKNGRDVSVDWEFDSNKNIIIRSNVDLTGVLLVAHGK